MHQHVTHAAITAMAGVCMIAGLLGVDTARAERRPIIYQSNDRPSAFVQRPAKVFHVPPNGNQPLTRDRPQPDMADPVTVVGLVTQTEVHPQGIPAGHTVVTLTTSQDYDLLIDLGPGEESRQIATLLGPLLQITGRVKDVEGRTILVAEVIFVSTRGSTTRGTR